VSVATKMVKGRTLMCYPTNFNLVGSEEDLQLEQPVSRVRFAHFLLD